MAAYKSGDVAFIPKGTVHAFKNVGTTGGRLRYMFAPAASIEKILRVMYAEVQEVTLSSEQMAKITLKHN